jgi:hypothetical protein
MPLTVDSGRLSREYDYCCLLTHTAICDVRKKEVMLQLVLEGHPDILFSISGRP